jgi:hypothetical protein
MAENLVSMLDSNTINTITSSSYLHLAHYHELGNDNVMEWIDTLKQTKQQAKDYFYNVILDP